MKTHREAQIVVRVYNRISEHTIYSPIKIKALAMEFGIDEREVKRIIEQLIDSGCKIGSCKKPPMGVFKAIHPAEIYPTAERMKREGIRYLLRAKKLLTWDGNEPTIFEQMPEPDEIAAEYDVTLGGAN